MSLDTGTDRISAQLAVLATFDPERPPADALPRDVLESRCVVVEGERAQLVNMLSESSRIEALAAVLRDAGRTGLCEIRRGIKPHYSSALQTMLDAFVLERDVPLVKRTEDELAASMHVERWSTAALARAGLSGERVRPTREEIEGRIRVLGVERPIRAMLEHGFIGRSEELARLKSYLHRNPLPERPDDVRSAPRPVERRGLHSNPAFLVYGVGGMGKSALVARFVNDLIDETTEPKPIWAYLDFDRPTLQPQRSPLPSPEPTSRAWLVLNDIVRQVGAQRPDLGRLLERDVTYAQHAFGTGGLESFAGEDYRSSAFKFGETLASAVGNGPVVVVIDTLEEVERRGPEEVDQLYELFDVLTHVVPGFHLVVSGRTPANRFRTTPDNELQVGELTESDARELLLHFTRAEADNVGIQADAAKAVYEIVGLSPLSLRLAARAIADEGVDAFTDAARRTHTLGRIRTEFVRGFLYHRIINHLRPAERSLRDPLRAIARAGLVLRAITRPAIEHVLLPAVELDRLQPVGQSDHLSALAGQLFEALVRESALVRAVDANTLVVREELRGPALSALRLDDPALVRTVHGKAVTFHAGGFVGADPLEAVFHHFAGGESLDFGPTRAVGLLSMGMQSTKELRDSLERSWAELPKEAADFLQPLREGGDVLDAEGDQVVWERHTAAVADTALREGDLGQARKYLQERDARRPTTALYQLEARICEAEGDLDGAVAAAQRDLSAARLAERSLRFAAAAAYLSKLLEQRGSASDALTTLTDAHADALLASEWALRLELVLYRLAAAERTALDDDNMRWELGLLARQYLTRLDVPTRDSPALVRLLAAALGRDEPTYIREAMQRIGLDPDAGPERGIVLGKALREWNRRQEQVARAIKMPEQEPSIQSWIARASGLGKSASDVFGTAFWALDPPLTVLSALRSFYLWWGYRLPHSLRPPTERIVATHFFDEAQLDYARTELRELESLLLALYRGSGELQRLADVAGLDPNMIDWQQAPGVIVRSLLDYANKSDRIAALVQVVLSDAPPEMARRLRTLIGADWIAHRRFINVAIEDEAKDAALAPGQWYVLAFDVDVAQRTDALSATRSQDEALLEQGGDLVELTVQLTSNDMDIIEPARQLHVPRVGKSQGKARFDISPKHEGTSKLTATFHKQGNFVQQIDITFEVGTRVAPASVSRGRQLSAANALLPRDVGLVIQPSIGGYDCMVWGAVAARAKLPLQPAYLASVIDRAREELMRVVQYRDALGRSAFLEGIDIPDRDLAVALQVMARAGGTLFQQLFFGPAAADDSRKIGEFLRKIALGPGGVRLRLQIVAEMVPVPWGLLYLGDMAAGAALDWNNFLGMRHVIEVIPLQNQLNVVESAIRSDNPNLSVSLNMNEAIDAQVGARHVEHQKAFWKNVAQARKGVRITSRTSAAQLKLALADSKTDDQILYFYCPATSPDLNDPGGPGASSLVLTDAAITLDDLYLDSPTSTQLAGNPLVFINACESGQMSPAFYDGFVPYFMAKGARGVIGTECYTPALFAAAWAKRFFERFLDGETLGDAFLGLRQEFLVNHGNPLGLMYAVHCDSDTQIQPALKMQLP